jgi:hypothetical protein
VEDGEIEVSTPTTQGGIVFEKRSSYSMEKKKSSYTKCHNKKRPSFRSNPCDNIFGTNLHNYK